jgi:hypothetical protein
MAIHPTNPDSPRRAGPAGAEPGDRVTPAAARELHRNLPDPSHRLPPDRLRTLLTRLTDGFYERSEVLDVVARGVAADLGISVAGG